MNAKHSRFLARCTIALFLFSTSNVMAGDYHKKDYRRHDGEGYRAREVSRELNRHERERRAFVAGAAAQQHRDDYRRDGDRYRDGYHDRYRDRYDDRDDTDNLLIGAAVGAIATGLLMSDSNK